MPVTERLVRIDWDSFPEELPERGAELLREGGVVVHPTETVHGYGARFDLAEAVERIRALKGRETGKPMLLLVPGPEWVDRLARGVSPLARRLMESFWPGPLTLVFEAGDEAHLLCPWAGESIALRQGAHPFTSRMLERLGLPLVSTSLNRAGEPPAEDPAAYLAALSRALGEDSPLLPELAVLDQRSGGPGRLPSTVVRVSGAREIQILREGALGTGQIAAATEGAMVTVVSR